MKHLHLFLTYMYYIKWSTDSGRGVKGAPSASTDNNIVAEGTININ